MEYLAMMGSLGIIYSVVAYIMFFAKATNKLHFKEIIGVTSIILVITTSVIVKIGAQEVGVVLTPWGVKSDPIHTGWHFVPWWNNVFTMDKTVWVYTFSSKKDEGQVKGDDAIWAPTKEGIKLGLDVSISWKIDPAYAPWIYQNVSANDEKNGRYLWIEENVIRNKTNSCMALTVSNYTPIEVYSNKRQDIQDDLFKKLGAELASYHILLQQVDIREVHYNEQYETAINNKKLAEQEAMRLIEVTKQKNELLTQSTIEKNIAIQTAQGVSEALKIKGQSITANPKIIQLQWIEKWDGALPTNMIGSSNGIMFNMGNLDKPDN